MKRTRMRSRRIINTVLLLIPVCCFAFYARGEDYPIKLSRPAKVGDKSQVQVTFTVNRSNSAKVEGADDVKEDKSSFKVDLAGVSETLAVDSHGEETKFTITIDKCVKTDGDKTADLIPKGHVLVAESKDKETEFTLKDGELSDEAKDALKSAIHAHVPDEPTDDEIFGTTERKKPGDTWPIHADALVKVLKRSDVKVDPKDISGTVKLVGSATHDGVPVLHIECDFEVRNLKVPAPAGGEQTQGLFRGSFAGMFPQDLSVPPLADSQAEEMQLTYKVPASDGQNAIMKSNWQRTIESKVKPVKE
jgi:hypothetical protein